MESSLQAKNQCVRSLLGLSARLGAAREACSFDIGDFCLQRCKPTIDKLASALSINHVENPNPAPQAAFIPPPASSIDQDPSLSIDSDLLLPLDTLDYQFDLFDDLGTPWPITA